MGGLQIRLSLSHVSGTVPDVFCAVGEPHSVMPVAARTAAAMEMVVPAVPVPAAAAVVTQIAAAAAAYSEGGLLGLVAVSEIGRQLKWVNHDSGMAGRDRNGMNESSRLLILQGSECKMHYTKI